MNPRLLVLLLLAGAAAAKEPSLEARVNRAIDRAAENLVGRQDPDGAWQKTDKVHPLGRTALCTFALLHAGYARDDPSVVRALKFLHLDEPRYYTELSVRSTYETGCLLLLLNALGSEYREPIHRLCDWLVGHFREGVKLWGYPDGRPDLSNTQYAVFGLKVGELHGYKVPKDLWRSLVKGVLRLQARDGAFRYRSGELYRATMTHAGLLVLRFALEAQGLLKRPPLEVRRAMERAQHWYEERYSVEHNPFGRGFTTNQYYYYMYGLERYAQFFELKEIAGHDWYREGAEELLRRQEDNGSWGNLEDTSFAILFLRKVTFTAPRARKRGRDAGAVVKKKPKEKKPKPREDVPFLREWLLAGPFFATKFEDDMLYTKDFPVDRVAPAPGARAGKRKWFHYDTIRDFIDLKLACGGKGEWCSFYAALYLFADEETEARLWLGTEKGCKVYLNGKEIFEGHHHGYCGDDHYQIPLPLRGGRNLLMIKVENTIYYSKLMARITGVDGNPHTGVRVSIKRRGP